MIKNFFDFLNENESNLEVNVIDKDEKFINLLITKLSFVYKKIKDRHTRPIDIIGNMSNGIIKLKIILSNKDVIKFEYSDGEIKITINNKLYYHDDIDKNEVLDKIHKVYSKFLTNQNFKLKKDNPFNGK